MGWLTSEGIWSLKKCLKIAMIFYKTELSNKELFYNIFIFHKLVSSLTLTFHETCLDVHKIVIHRSSPFFANCSIGAYNFHQFTCLNDEDLYLIKNLWRFIFNKIIMKIYKFYTHNYVYNNFFFFSNYVYNNLNL